MAQACVLGMAGAVWLTCNALDTGRLQASAQAAGPQAVARLAMLMRTPLVAGSVPEDRLESVNRFYNTQIEFRSDREVWGVDDFWASPMELLAKGQGDCEDFAIAKYFTLISLGIAPSRLRMVYVRAETAQGLQAHMVLAYYPTPGSDPLVLDNLSRVILPASRRSDLHPVFSFNAEGLWQGVGRADAGDPLSRLSRWRRVLEKARAEGWW